LPVSSKVHKQVRVSELNRGRVNQKLRTRRRILVSAAALVAAGATPTVTEAADAAEVSRRTAYRYFPTQEKLLTEAALEGLRGPMTAMLADAPSGSDAHDVGMRLSVLIEQMQSMAIRNESLLRTMIHQTVLERSSAAMPRRGTRRIDWIEAALKPLAKRISAKAYARLVSGLALCGGIEALLVLRDICGLSEVEAIEVSRWAAQALLKQTLGEFETSAATIGKTRRRKKSSKARSG
jgi:AcrR family transcriptional regulator